MTNGTLEAAHAQILEWHLGGANPPEIARRLDVSRQAVHKYLKKHREEFDAATAALEVRVVDNWITDKTKRLDYLRQMFDELRGVVDDHGYMVTETRSDGENEVTSHKFNGALPQQMRGILSDAASELGQIPRPDQNLNIRAQVLYRQIVGFDPEELG